MAKNIRRMLAMVLVLCMTLSALPMQALAAEESATEPTITVDAEIITNTDTTSGPEVVITFTPTANENVTDVAVSGTNESGAAVSMSGTVETSTSSTSSSSSASAEVALSGTETKGEGENAVVKEVTHNETTTNTVTTNADGSTTSQTINEGTEIKEWTGEGVENIEGAEGEEDVQLPSVEVELVPGGKSDSVTVTGKVEGTIGDEKEGKNDTEYDYTDVTIEVDRTVSAESSEIIVLPPTVETQLETSVDPTQSTDKHWNTGGNNKNNPQRDGLEMADPGTFDFEDAEKYQETPTEDGYDFILSGNGEYTDAAAPVFKYIVYQRYDEDDEIPEGYQIGDFILDEKGERIVDEDKSKLINGTNYDNGSTAGAHETGMDYQAAQLALTYKDGKYFYAYCADYLVETDLDPAHWYKMENLEDSGHYTEEDAAMLRAIAENGYWGTASGMGSLSQITENLTEYAKTNPTVIVKDKNGKDVEYNLVELLGEMKEHEALAVTQAAIWAYSINRKGTAKENEKLPDWADDIIVIGAQSAITCYTPNKTTEYTPANDQSVVKGLSDEERAQREAEALRSDARMKALFDYLMALEGKPDTATNVTTVINEKNYVEDISLTVHDRVADHDDNQDSDPDNDVYNTDLKFTLAFVPDPANDDLLVYLYDADGQVMTDKDGNPVVRRLAGENSEGREADDIIVEVVDGQNVYTLNGLQLSENSDITFDLRLEGLHNLANGVYLYTADGGRYASQTLVGMAKGTQSVDITASMTISFDVDENNHVVAERHWHTESDPVVTPAPENPTPMTLSFDGGEPAPQAQVFRLNNDDLEEIPEEPVPLAAPVITGDNSFLWIAIVVLSLSCMVAVNVFGKKRQGETF